MSNSLFTLDTNILIYSIDKDAGKKHAIAREIVTNAMQGNCILSLQVLSEFYAATTRKNYLSHAQSTEIIADFMRVFPIVHATSHSLEKALIAKEKYNLAFWDAMIWATAREGQCKVIISEDFQHDRTLEGVKFFNPFGI